MKQSTCEKVVRFSVTAAGFAPAGLADAVEPICVILRAASTIDDLNVQDEAFGLTPRESARRMRIVADATQAAAALGGRLQVALALTKTTPVHLSFPRRGDTRRHVLAVPLT